MSFVEIIKMRPDYIGANGRTEAEIVEAENELGITFAGDYREYLREIGLACFDSHELTGLTNTVRLTRLLWSLWTVWPIGSILC